MNINDLPSKWRKILSIMERSGQKPMEDFVLEIKFHLLPLLSLMQEGFENNKDSLLLDLKEIDKFKKESLGFEDNNGQQRIFYAVKNKLLGNGPLVLREIRLYPSKKRGLFFTKEDSLNKTYKFDFVNDQVKNFIRSDIKGEPIHETRGLR